MLALIIDDSRAMRSILCRNLDSLGFDVETAADGAEALALVRRGPLPDLALVDWNMPVMDGLEFITEIRHHHEWRHITLMMISTENEHSQIVRALAAGAHEYVMKPFTVDTIGEKLRMLGLL
jgi:two-component system chemotaxis response regulator CheY